MEQGWARKDRCMVRKLIIGQEIIGHNDKRTMTHKEQLGKNKDWI